MRRRAASAERSAPVIDAADQHRRRPCRLLARDDLQHAVVALVAGLRNDVGSTRPGGTSKFNRAAPREKFRRADRSRSIFSVLGSFKPRPLTCFVSPSQRTHRRTRFRTSCDHRHSLFPHVNQMYERAGTFAHRSARTCRSGVSPPSAAISNRRRVSESHGTQSSTFVRSARVPARDHPPRSVISTARNGASSTWMPTFSTGVTRSACRSSRSEDGSEKKPHQRRAARSACP